MPCARPSPGSCILHVRLRPPRRAHVQAAVRPGLLQGRVPSCWHVGKGAGGHVSPACSTGPLVCMACERSFYMSCLSLFAAQPVHAVRLSVHPSVSLLLFRSQRLLCRVAMLPAPCVLLFDSRPAVCVHFLALAPSQMNSTRVSGLCSVPVHVLK
jgi:hypothetical protein